MVFFAPAGQHALSQAMLTADLGGPFLARSDLSNDLQFEFRTVLAFVHRLFSFACLVFSLLHFGEVDFFHCPVLGVHFSLCLSLFLLRRSSSLRLLAS